MAKIPNLQLQLTKEQKKAITEQLANFFFHFWENQSKKDKENEKIASNTAQELG
jgi:hypothetical protein